jgi:hypothetical protein
MSYRVIAVSGYTATAWGMRGHFFLQHWRTSVTSGSCKLPHQQNMHVQLPQQELAAAAE